MNHGREIISLVAERQDLDQFRVPHIDVLEIVDFQTFVGFFEQGLPDNPAELIRVGLSLEDQMPAAGDDLFAADFADILPDGIDATLSLDQPKFSGQIVIGFDTSSSPFYVLTQPDEISSATTPIDVTFGLNGTLTGIVPLLGPILTIESGSLNL